MTRAPACWWWRNAPRAAENALFAGGFLWDVRGRDAVRHVESLFFGKTDQAVAQAYVTGLNNLPSWIAELGGEVVAVDPRRDALSRVLRPDGTAVPGLYAAGGDGSVWGPFTHSGGGLTDALVFGRLAGSKPPGAGPALSAAGASAR
jgi:hypothetical protein